jgi:hypothetical protein
VLGSAGHHVAYRRVRDIEGLAMAGAHAWQYDGHPKLTTRRSPVYPELT